MRYVLQKRVHWTRKIYAHTSQNLPSQLQLCTWDDVEPGTSGYVHAHENLGRHLQHHTSQRCRACSTAERTATNIVLAPIACASRCSSAPYACAPCSSRSCSPLLTLVLPTPHTRAPRSSLVLPAPHSCSPLLTRAPRSSLVLPAPHSCSLLSLLLLPAPHAPAPRTRAPFARSSLLGFGAALRHFRSPRVCAIPYLGFASQRLA